jgi:hypothetical protein
LSLGARSALLDVEKMAHVTLEGAHQMVPLAATFETIRVVLLQQFCPQKTFIKVSRLQDGKRV